MVSDSGDPVLHQPSPQYRSSTSAAASADSNHQVGAWQIANDDPQLVIRSPYPLRDLSGSMAEIELRNKIVVSANHRELGECERIYHRTLGS